MGNRDEEIIAARRGIMEQKLEKGKEAELEDELQESIMDGMVHVFGKEVVFVRREFEEFGISILMPETFEEVEEDVKAAIYPYGKAPKLVFLGEDIPFHIAFSKTEHVVPNEGIPKFMGIVKGVMERLGPKARILSSRTKQIGEHNIGIMELSTMGLDGAVFNYQFYISLADQRIEMVALTCPATKHKRLIAIMREMLDSVVFLEDKEENKEEE